MRQNLSKRQLLQQQVMDGPRRLVTLLEIEREYRTAVDYAQRLLQFEPFDETSYCSLMRLHAAIGDRAGALHIHHRCVNMLQKEFAATPTSVTQELYPLTILLLTSQLPYTIFLLLIYRSLS